MEIKISKKSEQRIGAIRMVNSLTCDTTDEGKIVDHIIEKYYETQKETLAEKVLGILDEPEKKEPKHLAEGMTQPKAVLVTDPYGRNIVFPSITAAAKHIGVTFAAVSYALRNSGKVKGHKVKFKAEADQEKKYPPIVVLDKLGKKCGEFATKDDVADYCGASYTTVQKGLKTGSTVNGFSVYYKVAKENLDKMNY